MFKNFNDENIVLDTSDKLVYTGSDTGGNIEISVITWSKEKGPLIDLSNTALEANEEYFVTIYFKLEE